MRPAKRQFCRSAKRPSRRQHPAAAARRRQRRPPAWPEAKQGAARLSPALRRDGKLKVELVTSWRHERSPIVLDRRDDDVLEGSRWPRISHLLLRPATGSPSYTVRSRARMLVALPITVIKLLIWPDGPPVVLPKTAMGSIPTRRPLVRPGSAVRLACRAAPNAAFSP